jgi:hypothetical protein
LRHVGEVDQVLAASSANVGDLATKLPIESSRRLAGTAAEGENMTSTTSQQNTNDAPEFAADLPSPMRAAEKTRSTLAETQTAMLKNLVTAQLTALESFERLMASTGPASEDLMNRFSREFMLGLFRLYPVGQEMSRHSLNMMTELARQFAAVLRSALAGVEGQPSRRPEAAWASAGKASSVSE